MSFLLRTLCIAAGLLVFLWLCQTFPTVVLGVAILLFLSAAVAKSFE